MSSAPVAVPPAHTHASSVSVASSESSVKSDLAGAERRSSLDGVSLKSGWLSPPSTASPPLSTAAAGLSTTPTAVTPSSLAAAAAASFAASATEPVPADPFYNPHAASSFLHHNTPSTATSTTSSTTATTTTTTTTTSNNNNNSIISDNDDGRPAGPPPTTPPTLPAVARLLAPPTPPRRTASETALPTPASPRLSGRRKSRTVSDLDQPAMPTTPMRVTRKVKALDPDTPLQKPPRLHENRLFDDGMSPNSAAASPAASGGGGGRSAGDPHLPAILEQVQLAMRQVVAVQQTLHQKEKLLAQHAEDKEALEAGRAELLRDVAWAREKMQRLKSRNTVLDQTLRESQMQVSALSKEVAVLKREKATLEVMATASPVSTPPRPSGGTSVTGGANVTPPHTDHGMSPWESPSAMSYLRTAMEAKLGIAPPPRHHRRHGNLSASLASGSALSGPLPVVSSTSAAALPRAISDHSSAPITIPAAAGGGAPRARPLSESNVSVNSEDLHTPPPVASAAMLSRPRRPSSPGIPANTRTPAKIAPPQSADRSQNAAKVRRIIRANGSEALDEMAGRYAAVMDTNARLETELSIAQDVCQRQQQELVRLKLMNRTPKKFAVAAADMMSSPDLNSLSMPRMGPGGDLNSVSMPRMRRDGDLSSHSRNGFDDGMEAGSSPSTHVMPLSLRDRTDSVVTDALGYKQPLNEPLLGSDHYRYQRHGGSDGGKCCVIS